MRALIVDDSAVIRQMIMRMLKPCGFEFVEAVNGVDAVAKFKTALQGSSRYDLVMLDIEMPEMDGQRALKEIRTFEKNMHGVSLNMKDYTTILMLTSLNDPKNLMEAYVKGKCNGYLTKPVVVEELFEKLRKNNLIS